MAARPSVVVLTPVKNEAWILDRFLSVASTFADLIVVSDQNSTDGSGQICARYEKVHVVENRETGYDEGSRQKQLIATARALVPGPRILLALDSDEVLAADATETADWERMMSAAPGTVLSFEKPDLWRSPRWAIRYENPWPLGYVDDGCEHRAQKVHSIRIPQPEHAQELRLTQIKILHYALTRPAAQRAKLRYYSVIENVNETAKFYSRRRRYAPTRDFARDGRLEESPASWFEGWTKRGIDMFTVNESELYWYDLDVLRLMARYGHRRFWIDDIWDVDWEETRRRGLALGYPDIPSTPIVAPPRTLQRALRALDRTKEIYDSTVGPVLNYIKLRASRAS
jgi:glycosyltransferase involved in cell wall biosynthesis